MYEYGGDVKADREMPLYDVSGFAWQPGDLSPRPLAGGRTHCIVCSNTTVTWRIIDRGAAAK
jgi:hypothetical protein